MKLNNAVAAMAVVGILVSPTAAQADTAVVAATDEIANALRIWGLQSSTMRSQQRVDGAVISLAVVGAGDAGCGIVKGVDDDKLNGS